MNTLDEVSALNDKMYVIFGALHKNADLMNPKQVDFMSAKLYELYKEEYMRIYLRNDVANKREEYQTGARRKRFIPRLRLFLFRNKPAKLISEEIDIEAGKFFAECEKKLEEERPKEDTARKIGNASRRIRCRSSANIPKNGKKGKRK